MVTSGHGFDGGPGKDFADFLRRELHAAADQVEPGSDGLERIRDKIRSRPAHASRPTGARGVWLAISGFLAGLGRRLASVRGGDHPDAKRDGAAREGDARRAPKRPMDWREAMLRPAFAVGAAVFAFGVVLAVIPPARSIAAQVGNDISSAFTGSSPSNSAGTPEGGGTRAPSTAGGSQPGISGAIHTTQSSCASPSTQPSATRTATSEASSSTSKATAPATSSSGSQSGGSTTSQSASASSSPSAGVTPSGNPSGTPTPTVSHSPSPSPRPSPTADPTRQTTIQPTPNATCTSATPTHAAGSSPAAKTSASPKTSGSSSASAKASASASASVKASASASQSASSNHASSTGINAITPDTSSSSDGSGSASGAPPTSSPGP